MVKIIDQFDINIIVFILLDISYNLNECIQVNL